MPPPLSAVGCNGASGNDAVDGVACSSSLSSFSESASNMYTSAELSSSHWSISVEVWHASLTWSTFGIVEVARQSPATWLLPLDFGVWYSLPGPKPCAWCCCSISRENSSKVVVIVFIISGRSSLERSLSAAHLSAGSLPARAMVSAAGCPCGGSRMSIQVATRGIRVVDLDVDECAGCSPPLLESSGSSSSPLSAASCGGAFPRQ
eukprot:g12278.t1